MTDTEIDSAETENGEDLRSTIEAAMREAAEQDAEDFGDDPIESAAEAKAARDELGRFARKQVSDQPEGVAQQEAIEPIPLPKSWSADQKERFNALPRELQQYLAERESQRDSFLGQKSEQAARYERNWAPVERELGRYNHYFEQLNTTPQEAILTLFKAQEMLDRDPARAIAEMAASYGLDLAQVATQQVQRPQIDPAVQKLYEELNSIRSHIGQQQQAQQAEYVRGLETEVEAFAQAKDASGQPLRPHFEAVWESMVPEVQFLRSRNPEWTNTQVLERAYKRAITENENIQKQEAQRAEAERVTQARAKAAAAKKAGSSLSGGNPGGGLAPTAPGDLRSTIVAAMRGEL